MVLDIIAAAVIAVMCIWGVKRGILKTVVSVCSWLLSTVLAWIFYSPVAEFLKTTPVFEYILNAVKTGFTEPRAAETKSAVPELFRGFVEAGIDNGADAAALGISNVIIALLAFVMTLLLCRVLILLLAAACKMASRLPVVKQCNKLLGGLLGAAEGVLILYIAAALVFAFEPVRGSEFFEDQLSQSVAASQIYNNNFIINFLNHTSIE